MGGNATWRAKDADGVKSSGLDDARKPPSSSNLPEQVSPARLGAMNIGSIRAPHSSGWDEWIRSMEVVGRRIGFGRKSRPKKESSSL